MTGEKTQIETESDIALKFLKEGSTTGKENLILPQCVNWKIGAVYNILWKLWSLYSYSILIYI